MELAFYIFLSLVVSCYGFYRLTRFLISTISMRGQRHEKRDPSAALAAMDEMAGFEFEHFVASVLQHNGFTDVRVTKGSGDFGADIIATREGQRFSIQVKRNASKISRRAISDAVAAKAHYGCSSAMVVTNNYFTKQARIFAQSVGCQLLDRDVLTSYLNSVPTAIWPVPTQGFGDHANEDQFGWNLDAVKKIEKIAGRDTPRDTSMQQEIYREELEALRTLTDFVDNRVPPEILTRIRAAAQLEWPDQYGMQLWVVEEQAKAYSVLQHYAPPQIPQSVLNGIKIRASSEWPDNFEMQVEVVKEEVIAYKRLKDY